MLSDVVDLLRCPHCHGGLALAGPAVQCAAGHSFDVARQGYVTLVPGTAGDTAEMVAARERFLGAGHFDPIARAVADAVGAGPVVEIGAGTGYYLARTLDGDRVGVALDSSGYALRRAARAHARIGAVGGDVWGSWPLRDEVAGTVLCAFAPRNGPEIARVLRPDGILIVVTPTQRHLAELADAYGLLSVDDRKRDRLDLQLAPHLRRVREETLEFALTLDAEAATALVQMGPSAHHGGAVVRSNVTTTASVELSAWRHPF